MSRSLALQACFGREVYESFCGQQETPAGFTEHLGNCHICQMTVRQVECIKQGKGVGAAVADVSKLSAYKTALGDYDVWRIDDLVYALEDRRARRRLTVGDVVYIGESPVVGSPPDIISRGFIIGFGAENGRAIVLVAVNCQDRGNLRAPRVVAAGPGLVVAPKDVEILRAQIKVVNHK